MTVNTPANRNSYTVASPTTGPFAYTFLVIDADHLAVYVNETQQTSGFTISGVGNPEGGDVTFDNDLAANDVVLLQREVPYTQLIDYRPYDPFPAETHEQGLDLATMMAQQNQRAIEFSLRVADTETQLLQLLPDPATRANKFLFFDADGQPGVGTGQTPPGVPVTEYSAGLLVLGDQAAWQAALDIVPRAQVRQAVEPPQFRNPSCEISQRWLVDPTPQDFSSSASYVVDGYRLQPVFASAGEARHALNTLTPAERAVVPYTTRYGSAELLTGCPFSNTSDRFALTTPFEETYVRWLQNLMSDGVSGPGITVSCYLSLTKGSGSPLGSTVDLGLVLRDYFQNAFGRLVTLPTDGTWVRVSAFYPSASFTWTPQASVPALTGTGMMVQLALGRNGTNGQIAADQWVSATNDIVQVAGQGKFGETTGDLLKWTNWQIDLGDQSAALPLFRPPPLDQVYDYCLRYFQRHHSLNSSGAGIGTGFAQDTTRFRVTNHLTQMLRRVPAVSFIGSFTLAFRASSASVSSWVGASSNVFGGELTGEVASGLTAGEAVLLRHGGTDSYIDYDAELST